MATYYISPTGNDSTGAGTQVSPWATISKAVSSSSSGDTISCLAGTYTWVNQLFSDVRNIIGASPVTTIFDAGAAAVSWTNRSILSISNLTFQNNVHTGFNYPFESDNINSNTSVQFTNCILTGMTVGGSGYGSIINADTAINTLTLIGCLVYGCATTAGEGSIITASGGTSSITVILANSTFYSNIAAADTLSIIAVGLFAPVTTSTVSYTNNIFYNANGTPKNWVNSLGGTGGGTVAGSNNDVIGYSGTPSLPNQLSTDPLFVDPINANFNLRPTSPCIGAGTMI